MTLNSHFALNTVFRVKSFSVDALVLRHCFKIDGDAHILSAANMEPTVCGFWRHIKAYADICRGSLVTWC